MNYLYSFFDNVACSDGEKEPNLQISIRHKESIKYKFVRSNENTIKFYNEENFIQEFTNYHTAVTWVQVFLACDDLYEIVWHRENEKGVSVRYSEEKLTKLLKLLLTDSVV